MKLFGEPETKQASSVGTAKTTFKIEINDEEKKIRDQQNTTVYHTGGHIELDEEDRKEMERHTLEDIDEEAGIHDDDDEDEDDPDEDLDI